MDMAEVGVLAICFVASMLVALVINAFVTQHQMSKNVEEALALLHDIQRAVESGK